MPVGAGFIPARIGENKKMTEHKKLQPEIRFAGFTDDWEQRKLGEIVDVFDGTHQTPKYTDKGIMFLSVEDIKTLKSEKYISEEDFKKEFKYFPEIGDVLMTRIGDVGTTNVICSTQPIAYYVSLALLKNKNSDPYFLSTVISSGSVQSDIWKRTLHIAFPKKINKSEIEKVIIPLPSYVEQTQIGNFFKQLDDTIALHQRTLEKYQKLKISYLEKMFPKGNELYPELRFPNFTDAWEQCKLGDVVNIIMGQSPDSKNYTNNSSDHILVQGNADIKNGFVYPRVWTTQITKQSHSGDLIMSVRAPVGDIAKTEYDVVLGRGVCAIKGNEFIFQLLTKMKENDYWESLSTGSTFDSINSNDIKNAEIFIPSLEEQTQIGNFFKQLDNTIALHQQEVEKYKKIKQSYLEKMFI
ncbi:restriction modification system DNA specificity subunit [Haemophilus parahaemolyticus]|uniref:Restriction modification system DNA specificity subunit n=2 Tax=Haemophilus parahaemolyticus TaxID=735 RepID=A0A377I2K7_HAEPH|nr:restriction modification system DNA specificity subunit [Haemophilus parahaemolyticus]